MLLRDFLESNVRDWRKIKENYLKNRVSRREKTLDKNSSYDKNYNEVKRFYPELRRKGKQLKKQNKAKGSFSTEPFFI